MSRVREQLEAVHGDVRRRNPAEPEFHQADACGLPGNDVVGANVAAFTRVADAMLALGMV